MPRTTSERLAIICGWHYKLTDANERGWSSNHTFRKLSFSGVGKFLWAYSRRLLSFLPTKCSIALEHQASPNQALSDHHGDKERVTSEALLRGHHAVEQYFCNYPSRSYRSEYQSEN